MVHHGYRRRTSAAALLSVALPFLLGIELPSGGCQTEIRNEPVAATNVMVPMRDGVKLATNVYWPGRNGVAVEGKFPVILAKEEQDVCPQEAARGAWKAP